MCMLSNENGTWKKHGNVRTELFKTFLPYNEFKEAIFPCLEETFHGLPACRVAYTLGKAKLSSSKSSVHTTTLLEKFKNEMF